MNVAHSLVQPARLELTLLDPQVAPQGLLALAPRQHEASRLAGYGEPPGHVGDTLRQAPPVSNGVASFSPDEDDRPLAKECIAAVGRGVFQEPAVAMPESGQTDGLAINPHLRSTGVRIPRRVEPLLGHSPDSMPDEYPPHRREWRAAYPRPASRGEHDGIAVVAEQRDIRVAGESLHDQHAVDPCTGFNRVTADYVRRRACRES